MFSFFPDVEADMSGSLAWMEMRLVIAKLVWMYELELVNKNQDWVHGNRAYAFWMKAPLWVRFKERN